MNAGGEIRHAMLVDQNALNHNFYRQRQEPPPAGLAELCDLIRRACKYHQLNSLVHFSFPLVSPTFLFFQLTFYELIITRKLT